MKQVLSTFLVVFFTTLGFAQNKQNSKPNIIIILADDMGF